MKVKVVHLIESQQGQDFFTLDKEYYVINHMLTGSVKVVDDHGQENILFDREYEFVEE